MDDITLGSWIDELTEADFPPQMQELVSVIGAKATVALALHFGGFPFYIPKADAILRKKRDELVRRDKALLGYKGCARKYGLTEVWVRQICDHRQADEGQQELFGGAVVS